MRGRVSHYLERAARVASSERDGPLNFRLGAVGIRPDGACVSAKNGRSWVKKLDHHCEARICRKLSRGSTVYLVRVHHDGSWAMSKPCTLCDRFLRNRGISRVYYSISPGRFGIWEP